MSWRKPIKKSNFLLPVMWLYSYEDSWDLLREFPVAQTKNTLFVCWCIFFFFPLAGSVNFWFPRKAIKPLPFHKKLVLNRLQKTIQTKDICEPYLYWIHFIIILFLFFFAANFSWQCPIICIHVSALGWPYPFAVALWSWMGPQQSLWNYLALLHQKW